MPSNIEDCVKLLGSTNEAGELLGVLPERLFGVQEVGGDLVTLVDGRWI